MQANSTNVATVWSQHSCQYCDMSKKALRAAGYTVTENMIGIDEGNYSKEHLLQAVPGARSVPQVFINGEYVGGYQEVLAYLRSKL